MYITTYNVGAKRITSFPYGLAIPGMIKFKQNKQINHK